MERHCVAAMNYIFHLTRAPGAEKLGVSATVPWLMPNDSTHKILNKLYRIEIKFKNKLFLRAEAYPCCHLLVVV
jgi:hypothetical protein